MNDLVECQTQPVEESAKLMETPASPVQISAVGEIAGRPDLIHISEAARIAGMTEAWLIRRMNEAGVTRIGSHLDYAEFKACFQQQARRRQQRITGRRSPVELVPCPIQANKSITAKALVAQLMGKARS